MKLRLSKHSVSTKFNSVQSEARKPFNPKQLESTENNTFQ